MNKEEINKKFEDIENRLNVLEGLPQKEISKDHGIFEVEEDKIIITKFKGKNTLEKTQNITLLTLLGAKQKLKKESLLASEIRESVATNKIQLENFGTYVNKLIPQLIIRKGKIRSAKTKYKLTTFGEAKAKDLLKELLEDGKKS